MGTAVEALNAAAIRADFPILATTIHDKYPLVYFDNAASTQRPRQVVHTLVDVYERRYANVHRGIHYLSEQSTELFEAARESVQRFINARQPHEVIFTSGTTAGVNLVARSWSDGLLREGDEILLTEMEHHSNIVPWQQAAQRTGARVRFVPVTDDGKLVLESLDTLLTERTRIFAFAAVSNMLGTVNPVATLVARAHAVGAVVVVDAAQSVPHEPWDVQSIDADFIVFSGHKMLGPSGIGVLYGREALLEKMPPFLGGGSMIRRVTLDGFEPADLPFKFEAGTPAIAGAIGLAASIDYLETVGLEKIMQHEQLLTRRCHEILRDIGDVTMYGPAPEEKGGIVSFNLAGAAAQDISELLDQMGVAIRAGHHCAMPLHARLGIPSSARASFYIYNTLDEVERFGEAMRAAKKTLHRKK